MVRFWIYLESLWPKSLEENEAIIYWDGATNKAGVGGKTRISTLNILNMRGL